MQLISTNEAIHQIQEVYHQQYAPDSYFDVSDQLLICQTLAESSPVLSRHNANTEINTTRENTSDNGNDGYQHEINAALFERKQSVIAQLQTCTCLTSRIEIADLLKALFSEYQSFPGHWLYIAQHWNPRTINRVIQSLSKLHTSGRITIHNPAAFFTFLIKKRKQRRAFTNANGGCRHTYELHI